MKTYVLIVSQTFPMSHIRANEFTFFPEMIKSGLGIKPWSDVFNTKIHTIRANYELWKKRVDEILAGKACLSIRVWTDKPYKSPQFEIVKLTKADGIGIQQLFFKSQSIYLPTIDTNSSGYYYVPTIEALASNDGLTPADFKNWFKKYDLIKPMAIIHFTRFRYK